MQGLNADEERHVLGEILADKLDVIEEYLESVLVTQEDIPKIKEKVVSIDQRLTVVEKLVRRHDKDLRIIMAKIA